MAGSIVLAKYNIHVIKLQAVSFKPIDRELRVLTRGRRAYRRGPHLYGISPSVCP